jgi:hypothetical protein
MGSAEVQTLGIASQKPARFRQISGHILSVFSLVFTLALLWYGGGLDLLLYRHSLALVMQYQALHFSLFDQLIDRLL